MDRYALNVWDQRFLSLTGGALSALISLPPEYNDDAIPPGAGLWSSSCMAAASAAVTWMQSSATACPPPF